MKTFTTKIVRFDSLPSTNLEASRRAMEGAPEGLCIVADEQTAGRGRLGRQWISPKGAGIYFSIVLRPQFDQTIWPLLTLMTAIAVRETLVTACSLQTDIKWPNDILHDEKKLCGILAETVETTIGRAVIVGIGINLTDDSFPSELKDVATSITAAAGRSADPEHVLEILQRCLAAGYEGLQTPEGPAKVLREWSRRSSYANGRRIHVAEGNEKFSGITRGLAPDGALRVETESGQLRIVRAGDVSVRANSLND
jgi:BirA family transcriptional regulator, biotin operon repressor / biotin---[acetyl-CoA-carboxylase] ligase